MRKGTSNNIIKKYFPFPMKMPISYEKTKIGELTVDFNLSLSEEKIKKLEPKLQRLFIYFFSHLWDEVVPFAKRLESELRLMDKYLRLAEQALRIRMGKDIFDSYVFMEMCEKMDIEKDLSSPLNNFLFMDKDIIFKLIKSEGPKTLANYAAQKKIEYWIKSKNSASIKKLTECLISLFNPKDKPLKVGRPTKKFSKTGIAGIHNCLLPRLQIMRKKRDWNFLDTLEREKLIEEREKHEGQNKMLIEWWLINRTYNNTWRRVIDGDNKLKEEFYRYRWAPHDMAIKILAKFTDMSYQKIKDYLYRK